MAIDPGLLTSKSDFMRRADELTKQLRSAKPLSGVGVMLPGEHGDALVKLAEASGDIEIADAIWTELNAFIMN